MYFAGTGSLNIILEYVSGGVNEKIISFIKEQ